uniref:FimD/PapC C-terminal domain-containing protein n=1 Tax=Escherichia coli TaxID=562 RepID=UPI0024082CF5
GKGEALEIPHSPEKEPVSCLTDWHYSIVAENGQVYLTGLPQSGQLQVSWGKDKNSNCIVEYKLPEVSPGTLLNQQTAICR